MLPPVQSDFLSGQSASVIPQHDSSWTHGAPRPSPAHCRCDLEVLLLSQVSDLCFTSLLFQALQDEVENYRGQVYDAQRRLQRNELKAQEQVQQLGAVLTPWARRCNG